MRLIVEEFRRAVAADGPILAGVAAVFVACVLILAFYGVEEVLRANSYLKNLTLFLVLLAPMAIFCVGKMLYRDRPVSPIAYLAEAATSRAGVRAVVQGIPMLVAHVIFMPVFSGMKSAIPLMSSYRWDATLIAAERALYGKDAWLVLQPVVGTPLVSALLSYAYHAWIFLIYAGGVYFAFIVKDRTLRAQYFIGFFSIWTVLGIVMAIGLASVGPCFLGPIIGDHSFDEQMAYLHEANEHYPVLVLNVQQTLLDWYQLGSYGLGRGISAMPSMHVAMATLFALGMIRISRPVGVAAFAFAAVIMVGSVHLGYHYSLDGYVGGGMTMLIWVVSGRLAKRLDARELSDRADIGQPAPAPALA